MKKSKVCVSISCDIFKDLEKYAAEREISFSVAMERMLIKGLESTNNFKEEDLINQLKNLFENSNVSNEKTEEVKEEVKENKIDRNELSEDDNAIFNIFDSIPD